MRPMDAIGNELFIDDMVIMSDDKGNRLYGLIVKIDDNNILKPGQEKMNIPGVVTVGVMPMTFMFDYNNIRIMQLTKVVKPPQTGKKSS